MPEERWTLKQMFDDNAKWLTGLGLPTTVRPKGLGEEYSFPTNVAELQSNQLGLLSLQLTSYYTYALQLLGTEDSELGAIQEVYDIKLGLGMADESSRYVGAKVPVKEILIAKAIDADEDLKRLHRTLISRKHRVKILQTQTSIYHEQLLRLSREQSRRDAESRIVR